jgi:hypothetical protein
MSNAGRKLAGLDVLPCAFEWPVVVSIENPIENMIEDMIEFTINTRKQGVKKVVSNMSLK